MSQQFRASAWINYDPEVDVGDEALLRSNKHFSSMNDDVDMDAPQISTLPEDGSPPPSPARTSKFRVKLLVNDHNRAASQASTSSGKPAPPDSDEDEDEDEEDQLIDDDDEEMHRLPAVPAPAPVIAPVTLPSTRGTGRGSGRGTRGTGRGRGRGSRGGRRGGAPVESMDPMNRVFSERLFSEPWSVASPAGSLGSTTGTMSIVGGSATEKKKPGPARGTQRAIRKKPSKPTKVVVPPLLPRDDAESVVSEGFPPTAVSSPMPHGDHSPEPDIPAGPMLPPPILEDSSLEGVPVPLYPLPTKPFPVQPPVKIGTGFAPAAPLDKTKKPVRRWREVKREVRGIAGGRWFTRTWLGDKESDYASAVAASNATVAQAMQAAAAAQREAMQAASLSAAGLLSIPKLPPLAPSGAVSAPAVGTGRGRGRGRADPFVTSHPLHRPGSTARESVSASIPRKRKAGAAAPAPEIQPGQPGPAEPMVL